MFNKLKNTLAVAMALFVAAGISACSKSKKDEVTPDANEKKYGALLQAGAWPNTTYYLIGLSNLKEGTIDLKGKGVNISNIVQDQGLIQRNGYYYYYNTNNSRLGKYHLEDDKLVTDREVPFTLMGGFSSHVWVDDNTLVVFGTDGDQKKMQYATININTLQATGGTLATPAVAAGFLRVGVGFAEYRSGKIFVGYGFLGVWPNPAYKKVMVAVLNYPSMAVSKILEDDRSLWAGGPTRYTPYSFIDENNDLYFTTVPEGGWDYEGASWIYRIKNGSEDLDNSYTFNFSSKSNGHTIQAMWYIGNGKAIVRARIPADRSNPDFYYAWDSYFSVTDVSTGTVVKKLDMPMDTGDIYIQAVTVEDGKAYIMLNDNTATSAIWEYDPAIDKLTKGATFGAGYDFLLRLDKWK